MPLTRLAALAPLTLAAGAGATVQGAANAAAKGTGVAGTVTGTVTGVVKKP